ncbi:MAG: ABC transporter ATP-binding protein [Planctomycetes bacterium]|jgi:putative ABC transport system ATP-binding protein|nr:ABC transporter ATP-binding protein [Planctomycetota bacterium]
MALLELDGINKVYGEGEVALHVLRDVDLAIEERELVALIGASGSGKSTLMNILGCLDRPSSGTYRLRGEDVSRLSDDRLSEIRNREIGFVFQSFMLVPQLTVLENVEVPLFYRGLPRPKRHAMAREVLGLVGLAARIGHKPPQLSGGERQRVAIARALVNDPLLLLADEPTGNLDSRTGEEILRLFDGLHAEGHTILMVTHDTRVADRAQRRVTIRDGRIIEDTAVEPAGGKA